MAPFFMENMSAVRPQNRQATAKNPNCHPDLCILPQLCEASNAPGADFSLTLARNDEMHEIPNLPFPSLNPEEPTVTVHAEPAAAVEQDGDDQSSADQE
ncbi:hypothetical protein [Pseudomonas asiatica]|uniref:hypothetical protein n=1 Tax=Pseudomonas asiatica TaxID=2219225 RepID=UPI0010C06F56|nr:hypothetical protein [Pseudomonas asiatica]